MSAPVLLAVLAATSCTQLVDVAEPEVAFEAQSSTPLRRTHQLLHLFSSGEGELDVASRREPIDLAENLSLAPLPWQVHPERLEHVRLLAWQGIERGNDESFPAVVLRAGESWCARVDTPPGAQLRFEAFSLERERPGTLTVGGRARTLAYPQSLDASQQVEVSLTSGSFCFEVTGGAVAIGEPRIVVPEEPGMDARPRWVALTIVDALRRDALQNDARDVMPALGRLRDGGTSYDNATSPGCHTRASVWPILTGRDLMRIDPLKRRQSMPIQSPLEATYGRANLFITHWAESAGYHTIFLGNNAYFRNVPAFARYSSWGDTASGTFATIEKLPDLFARYADERVLLVYYVSTPHAQSRTPKRLYEALSCGALEGVEECRCAYDARVRHADEAVAAFQRGLSASGLQSRTTQIITADHGELFGDGMPIEGELPAFEDGVRRGAYLSFDVGHGNACHARETEVPLVVHGEGFPAARRSERVSGLDIVPSVLKLLDVAGVSKLDGRALPSFGGTSPPDRPIVQYGFCSDSRTEGDRQLVWWVQGCRMRSLQGKEPITRTADLWVDGERVETSKVALHPMMARHEAWLVERLPAETFVFGVPAGAAVVTLLVDGGRITDYGPAATVDGLDRIENVAVDSNGSRLTVTFRDYRGLFHVSTVPPLAPIRIETKDETITFAGPNQYPLEVAGRWIDPAHDANLFIAPGIPNERPTTHPALRFWWQSFHRAGITQRAQALTEFDRVLREWGYIR